MALLSLQGLRGDPQAGARVLPVKLRWPGPAGLGLRALENRERLNSQFEDVADEVAAFVVSFRSIRETRA